MGHFITYCQTEVKTVELLREPTEDEIEMIEGDDLENLPKDLVDWAREEIVHSEYSDSEYELEEDDE